MSVISGCVDAHTEKGAVRGQDLLLLVAFFSSGLASLGFELVWVRVLGIAFGSESFGMLGVLAAFFGGVALGSVLLHRRILRSPRPIAIYAAAEGAIAIYAAAAPLWMLRLGTSVPRVLGPFVGDNRSLAALTVNLTVATVALLPATVCMGATMVAVVEAWRRRRTAVQNQTTVAVLYASNTLGATAGTLLSTYWLLPTLGIERASVVLAGFSVLAAATAWRWGSLAIQPAPAAGRPIDPGPSEGTTDAPRLIYALLFLTGLAGIGIETVGTQVLAQILENTVYTFANILAVYLLGTALGACLMTTTVVRRRWPGREDRTAAVMYALAAGGIVTAGLLRRADAVFRLAVPAAAPYSARLAAQSVVIAGIFLPATVCMGAAFSQLVAYFTEDGVGYAAAWNTIGAAAAPFVFGLVLIPWAGYGASFDAAVGLYLIAFFIAAWGRRRQLAEAILWACAGAAAILAVSSPLVLVRFGPRVDVLEQRAGLFGVVTVADVPSPGAVASRLLIVDQNFQMGGSPGGPEKRMGHLPMLVAGHARDVVFLGVGTGISTGATLADHVERLTAVELVPQILDELPWFGEFNNSLQQDPRAALRASDARRFIAATPEMYDVIVAELFHPSRDGTASLYTREHFTAIRAHLRPNGLFVQWLPIYQIRPRDLKTIVRTFLAVFPNAHSAIASYSVHAAFGLIGWNADPGAAGVDVARAEALLDEPGGAGQVFEGIDDLLGSYMTDADGLRQFAGTGPINTDDNQRITFDAAAAARLVEGADFYQTLASVLAYRRPFPDSFVATTTRGDLAALRRRAGPYGESATHYLAAEIALRREPGDPLPASAVSEYLQSYRLDAGFTSAKRRLLELTVQSRTDPRTIVERMRALHPEEQDLDRLHTAVAAVADAEQARLAVARFLVAR